MAADAEPHARTGVRRGVILAEVARGARLDRNYLLLIALSASIATLGLLQSSTAVVIGAMLVSPLMAPIMGIGFGLATFDNVLLKRSVTTLLAGMAMGIIVSALLVFISPVRDVTPELAARTQPSLIDLGIAVVGGIAGVFSIIRRQAGVMVGVAIATALMPPLSTVGFGLVTGRPEFALGAALLFLTNALAIAFAATVVARINRFGPSLSARQTAMQSLGIVAALGILSVPLAISLNSFVAEVRARSVVRAQIEAVLGPAARINTLQIGQQAGALTVDAVAIVPRYAPDAGNRLQSGIGAALGGKVVVNLAQIRSQSGETEALQTQFETRLHALETHDAESGRIIAALLDAGLARQALLVDPQARRIIVNRDPQRNRESDVERAIDAALARVQRANPEWLVLTGELRPVPPEATPAEPPTE